MSTKTIENLQDDARTLHEIIKNLHNTIDELKKRDSVQESTQILRLMRDKAAAHELLDNTIHQLHLEEARARVTQGSSGITPGQIAGTIAGAGFVDIRFGLRNPVDIPGVKTYGDIITTSADTKKTK